MLKWNDVWVLCAIKYNKHPKKLNLSDVIGYADFINHAILMHEEFTHALEALESAELIQISAHNITLTEQAQQLFKPYETEHPFQQCEKIHADIKKAMPRGNSKPLRQHPAPWVSKEDFDRAVQQYLDKMNHYFNEASFKHLGEQINIDALLTEINHWDDWEHIEQDTFKLNDWAVIDDDHPKFKPEWLYAPPSKTTAFCGTQVALTMT